MPQSAQARLPLITLAAACFALFALPCKAATWVAFGPETFTRSAGASTVFTRTFSVLNPKAPYSLQINNGGLNGGLARSVGSVKLNGTQVIDPAMLNPAVPLAALPVQLLANNQLEIELRGAPGGGIALQVIGTDLDPPSISANLAPQPNTAGWNRSDVAVSFACSDQTSGVAVCPSPVTVTSEGANQVVSGTATDKAGNTRTTSVTVNIDKTPPLISANIDPPPDAAGWNSSAVTVSFGCTDPLSGIASCSPAVVIAAEGANQIVTGTATDIAGNTASVQTTVNISTSLFTVRNYGGKCLDYGSGANRIGNAVFLNDCALAHPIRIQEATPDHQVYLHAETGSLVIGLKVDNGTGGGVILNGNPPGPAPTQYSLELQPQSDLATANANQLFTLDGDSIILAANRSLVLQVQNARGLNGTPIIAGQRNLADAEFWDFGALDGSHKDPTSGFVRVAALCDLLKYLRLQYDPNPCFPGGTPSPAGPGTVIRIMPSEIDLSGLSALEIPAGVTIRGGRRGTLFGPLLKMGSVRNPQSTAVMLDIQGDDVRITGLRLQGTSRETYQGQPGATGIGAHDSAGGGEHYLRSIIDHNDISDWTDDGVSVDGHDPADSMFTCDPNVDPYTRPRPQNVFVARNFLHHNRMQDRGYGVGVDHGSFPLIEGNTFVSNRHAIAADGYARSGYRARFNLALDDVPLQRGIIDFYTHTFDMHGTGLSGCLGCVNGFGGRGGDYVDIFGNTFLSAERITRHLYELRGIPCHYTDLNLNAFLETKEEALNFKIDNYQLIDWIAYMNIADNPSQFQFPNPTNHLGRGDFDGDGALDLFLATGTAWYYAPGGSAEWRFLSARTDPIDTLLFGDFDGDGRTDVVGINGSNLMVSWGGVSDWEVLNSLPAGASIADLAVGDFVDDFVGDNRTDIFYADGTNWYVSSGGTGPFNWVNQSSFRVKDLRFGDFDGDKKTDVFGVVFNGKIDTWSYSKSAKGRWEDGFLQEALTRIDRLVVADFDGDGIADVATWTTPQTLVGSNGNYGVLSWDWAISYTGAHNWILHQITPNQNCDLARSLAPSQLPPANWSSQAAGIGRFGGNNGADILVWNGNGLCIVPGGTGDPQRFSRQDMR